MQSRDYNSTLARIAGNIAGGLGSERLWSNGSYAIARHAVDIAKEIIAIARREQILAVEQDEQEKQQ